MEPWRVLWFQDAKLYETACKMVEGFSVVFPVPWCLCLFQTISRYCHSISCSINADSLTADGQRRIGKDDPYFRKLSSDWSKALRSAFAGIEELDN